MPFEMYGAEASPGRLIEQDQQQAALRRAQTRQLDAAASKVEGEVQQEKIFARIMQEQAGQAAAPGQQPTSMAAAMESAAQAALKAGLAGEATKLAGNASLLRQRDSAVAENKAQEQAAVMKLQMQKLSALSGILGGVKDQATWDEANAVYAKSFGQVSPYAGQPYDQALVDRLQGATTTAAQRAALVIKEADQQSKDKLRRSAAEFRDFRKDLSEKELALRQEREDRIAKNVGTTGPKGAAVGSPTGSEQSEASRILKAEFPNWPKEDLQSAAYAMASRARGLRRANKALEPQEALQQAFEEAKVGGVYEINEGLFKDSTKLRRDKLAQTPLTAAPSTAPAAKPLPGGWTVRIK
jgi:hypothetical protein